MGGQRRPLWSRFGTQPRPPAAEGHWRHGGTVHGLRARLDELPRPAWVVVHDLPLGTGGTLDHLVLGPPRAFAVSAVHPAVLATHSNSPGVDDDDDPLARLVGIAELVDRQLRDATGIRAHVEPVAVLLGPLVLLDQPVADVTVLAGVEVPGWFLGQRDERITPSDVTTLEAAARAVGGPHRAPRPRPGAHSAAPPARSVSVTRWRGIGHDRWYVNLADGTTLGHLDAATGEVVVDRPEDQSLVLAVLRQEGAPVPERPGRQR